MTAVRCFSSQAMSPLLAWRNPQGKEETWMNRIQGIPNGWIHAGKVVTVEVGLLALTITSAVESVLYIALKALSLLVYPLSDKPYKFCAHLLQSSSFTILWGIADIVFYNILVVNVMTRESFARYWADLFNPTPLIFFRVEDRLEIAQWAQQYRGPNIQNSLLTPIMTSGQETAEIINQGARFITNEILAHLTPGEIELFEMMDASIIMFILTKAMFSYTVGSKASEPIPKFFKPVTQAAITTLRETFRNDPSTEEISALLKNLKQFEGEAAPKTTAAQTIFNQLRNAASGELQNSLFATGCWQKVCQERAAQAAITLPSNGSTANAT